MCLRTFEPTPRAASAGSGRAVYSAPMGRRVAGTESRRLTRVAAVIAVTAMGWTSASCSTNHDTARPEQAAASSAHEDDPAALSAKAGGAHAGVAAWRVTSWGAFAMAVTAAAGALFGAGLLLFIPLIAHFVFSTIVTLLRTKLRFPYWLALGIGTVVHFIYNVYVLRGGM